jgi:hypothetical protein
MERLLGRAVWIAGLVAIAALLAASREDLKRYLQIRRM